MIALTQVKTPITLEQFLEYPEAKPYSEYINGKTEQKPIPQGRHSTLQIRLGIKINEIVVPNKLAHAFTELRCTFAGVSIVPDISVFTWDRIPKNEQEKIANRFETFPDWVIEILSPEQSANKVIKKIMFCLKEGAQLGWLIDPEDESVMILEPNKFPEIKSNQETLTVLKDLQESLQLSAEEMFNWLNL